MVAARKALAPGGRGGSQSVRFSEARGIGDGFQLRVEPSVEQHEKSEAGGLDRRPVPGPRVRLLAGRIVEPVPGVGKGLPQRLEVGVARVGVAVEAKVGSGLRLALTSKQTEKHASRD